MNQPSRVQQALNIYEDCEPLFNLLVDLRHWCDKNSVDFAQVDRDAYKTYRVEKPQ